MGPMAKWMGRGGCVAAVGVLLVLAAFGAGERAARADDGPRARPAATLPDVTRWAQDTAVASLEALGLDVVVVTVVDPLVGRVLAQVPPAGTPLAGLDEVRLHVGTTATAQVVVPNCVGMPLADARALLEPLFFCEIVEVDAAGQRAGTVLRQDPAAGRQLGFRARLRVEVARTSRVVPTVLGESEAEARARLEGAGLRVEVTYVDEPGLPAGRVSVQDPRAGAQALPGTTVRLRVVAGAGAGPRLVRVPDLVRLPLDVALQQLVAQDLVAQPTFQRMDAGRMYVVLEQGVAAYQRVPRGSVIPLTISRPRLSSARLRVPPVVGLTQDQATALLDGAGLATSVIQRLSPLPAGTVIESRPAGGTEVTSSALVTLVVARRGSAGGRTLVTVPDLVGATQPRARQELFDRGLMAAVLLAQAPDAPVDVVTEQRPTAGTQVEAGATVTIYVPDATRMPDLIGLTLAEARESLASRNLLADEVRVGVGGQPRSVVGQDPAAGVRLTTGSTVTLRHRREGTGPGPGPPPGGGIEVPPFVGLLEQEAKDTALAAGLGLSLVGLPANASQRRLARVQTQDHPAGSRVPFGTQVTIDFDPRGSGGGGGGGGLGTRVGVPDFLGLSEEEARTRGLGAGLGLFFQNLPASPTQRRLARVRDQSHAAGTLVPRGTEVTLDFAAGAARLIMPDMTGWTPQRARTWAASNGLGYRESSTEPPLPGQLRIVRSTTPVAGTVLASLTEIAVVTGNEGGLPPPPAVDLITVPNVVGMDLVTAMRTLSDEGLLPQVPVSTDLVRPVKGQDPVAGARVPRGSIVGLSFR